MFVIKIKYSIKGSKLQAKGMRPASKQQSKASYAYKVDEGATGYSTPILYPAIAIGYPIKYTYAHTYIYFITQMFNQRSRANGERRMANGEDRRA